MTKTRAEAKRDTRPCGTCGKPVTKLLSQVKPNAKGWYCSISCNSRMNASHGLNVRWAERPAVRDTRPCDTCGKPTTKRLSQVKDGAIWTCSRTCAQTFLMQLRVESGSWKQPKRTRTGDTIPCLSCGKEFYRQPQMIAEGRKYCSHACGSTAQVKPPVIKNCLTCQKQMRLKPSQGARVHCSKQCEAITDIKRPMERTHNGRPAKQDIHGYVMLWEPMHPNNVLRGWQYEHRLVAEKTEGRLLTSQEHVHHLNGIKNDNRPDNLEVMDGKAHARLSSQDYRADINRQLAKLAEYEKRFGPLT